MPSPNVCVIMEPTPANIADVPPTIVQMAPEAGSMRACASTNAALPRPSVASSLRASATSAKT
jgi:hypothetical protein